MKRVAILGAGICGLTAAFFRRADPALGEETWLLEAAPRPGGCVRTRIEQGLVFEEGPNTLRTTPEAERLLTDLQIWGEAVRADEKAPRFIFRDGRPRAVVPGPLGLLTDLLTFGEKLRVVRERGVPRRPDSLHDESVASFFRRRFGDAIARAVVGPMVSGIYAGDAEELSVRSAFPSLWDAEARSGSVIREMLRRKDRPRTPRHRPKTLTFRKGLGFLVDTLAERAMERGVRIHRDARVEAVEGPLPASEPHPFRLRLTGGETLDVDRILSTLPAAEVVRLFGDRLPRSAARLAALRSARVAVVNAAFEVARPADAPRGFGVLIPRGAGFHALGVLHPSALFPGRARDGVATTAVFLGGALDEETFGLEDPALLSLAEEETRRLHPRLGARIGSWLARWHAAIPRLPLGHHETMTSLDADLAELNRSVDPRGGVLVTGPWRDGISLGERIARGEALGRRL